ncbi:MAG TPA: S49 family peptidase [Aestuariivirgaceae bacterium]|nr:S49 family peptidase [Aestuariivirgaceae bacterium]
MRRDGFLSRFLPLRLRSDVPVVPVVRLAGTIGMGSLVRPSITLQSIKGPLDKAFRRKGIAAVALAVNSPGGSAVQSALIARRIRDLAAEKNVPVFAFVEDVAASGGYWLALAADEIYADQSSIVGSLGVMAAGFGFVEVMKKVGVERRVYTAGRSKMLLDPFQPEMQEGVDRLKEIQADVHESFKAFVRERRGDRLRGAEEELFSGAFWSARRGLEFGLVDGFGDMRGVLRRRYGDKVEIVEVQRSGSWLQRRLGGMSAEIGAAAAVGLAEEMEARALWSRFGL